VAWGRGRSGQDFLAVADVAVDFFAVEVFFAGAFLAVAVFFAVEVFLAGAFFAVDFFAVDFFAVEVFFGGAFLAVDFFAAVDFAAVDFVALDFFAVVGVEAPELFVAPLPAAALAVVVAFVTVALGSFLAPETTAFSSAPALNFGTAVFLALMRSPVRGLRTHRASRTRFSKEPKPVMATFSPLAISRVMVSSTDSSACLASLRLPSKRPARASIS
jgi:hypothetical protein